MYKKILVFIHFIFLLSCSQPSKLKSKLNPPEPPEHYKPSPHQKMTLVGNNSQGTFSPDGKFILYLSKNRKKNKNAQVYELNLETKIEKRISYHDGDDTSPVYHPKNKEIIFYSSTTDEQKERPQYILENLKKIYSSKLTSENNENAHLESFFFPIKNFEIYKVFKKNSLIQRITHSPGFDSQMSYSPSQKNFIYSSLKKDKLNLYRYYEKKKRTRVFKAGPNHEIFPQYSPNEKKILWVEASKDLNRFQLVVSNIYGKREKTLLSTSRILMSPFWHPSGEKIFLSVSTNQPGNFEIFEVNLAGDCLKRLTYTLAKETYPSFHPFKKQILFTKQENNESHIFVMNYQPPTNCQTTTSFYTQSD